MNWGFMHRLAATLLPTRIITVLLSARAVRRRVSHASATAPPHQAAETVESASSFYIGEPSTATASDASASAYSSTDVVPVTTHDGMREANPVTTHIGSDELAAMTHDG